MTFKRAIQLLCLGDKNTVMDAQSIGMYRQNMSSLKKWLFTEKKSRAVTWKRILEAKDWNVRYDTKGDA